MMEEQQDAQELLEQASEDAVEQTEADDTEIIEEARKMGWRPKEEFNGPEGNWATAEDFVERGKTVIPIMRENTKRLEAKIERQEKDFERRLEAINRTNQIAMKRQREQITQQAAQEREAAAELGDVDAHREATAREAEQLKALDDEVEEQTNDAGPSSDDKLITAKWVTKNTWFNANPVLKEQSMAHLNIIMTESPDMPMEDMLAEMSDRVKQDYPDQFNGKKTPTPNMEGGSRRGSSPASLTRKLPPEAKTAGEAFVKDGTYKDLAEYAADYFDEELNP